MTLPNILTALRILLAPLFYILFAVTTPPLYGWAVIVFVVAAITDWYDGYFARILGKTSAFGAFFDPLADKILMSFTLIAFAVRDIIPWWCVIVIIVRDIYMTMLRMYADANKRPLKTSTIAKYKTFFQMLFICYLLGALLLVNNYLGEGLTNTGTMMLAEGLVWWASVTVTIITVATAISYSYDNSSTLKLAFGAPVAKKSPQNIS
jgi:CDP-diacylglycerol--glycerol-3-phosphate 3-phosphatidyltransferase